MRRFIALLVSASLLSLLSCVREDARDVHKGPKMSFRTEVPQTKAFIDEINRSGNQLVVYDYMTMQDLGSLGADDINWYIDHARIQCTVDGQQVWDFVNFDDYYWIYGSHHKCFGWLYVGPSGYNTISFFGEHPEFNKDDFTLPLPAYRFTMESPLYDFLYSDITEREYTQQNPDSSPVALKMNHLFSAYRFKVRNVREDDVTVKNARLTVVTRKQATLDFSSSDKASIAFADELTETLSLENQNAVLSNTSAAHNLFHKDDPDYFRMVWPQDKTEFENAVLEVDFTEGDDPAVMTKTFPLKNFSNKEWLAGCRYAYELVFTDQEILLLCNVMPWNRKDITVDFTNVVVVSDKIQWHNNTIKAFDEHTGEVIVYDDRPAECYFKIDAPTNAKWIASLIPVEGDVSAFCFVDPSDPSKVLDAPEGVLGTIGRVMIKATDPTPDRTYKARLRIVVKTVDGRTIVVENLCAGHDYNEYTIVQNMR